MNTETIDRLFLELSQVTTATTANELAMRQQLADSQEQVTLLRDVLSDFDKAAINSKSIIGFAGQSFKLITKMRKALAATEPK